MKQNMLFYYDESGHSRKLTQSTITADNYDDYFVACIIGFEKSQRNAIEKDYLSFENKYKRYYKVEELKSSILSKRKYKYGFRSFKDKDIELLSDYLDIIIKHQTYIYFSAINKIEYLVFQLLSNYKNNILLDADVLRYSITKAISVYRPLKVIESIYHGQSFTKELRAFLNEMLKRNKGKKHKERENTIFSEALLIINDNQTLKTLDWDYETPFVGFKKYLLENKIETDSIVLDEEGSGKTKEAALKQDFVNSIEVDSKDEFGIRMADMLCGIINSFICSLIESLRYKSLEEAKTKILLSKEWFEINEKQHVCYKKLRTIINKQRNSWYKSFCSNYSDTISYFVCLLNYIGSSDLQYFSKNSDMNPEYLNTYVCQELEERYAFLRSKLPIEPANIKDGYFVDKRGAKHYLDETKMPMLSLAEGEQKNFYILNAGFVNKTNTPTVAVQTDKGPIVYRLPSELFGWAFQLVSLANMGENLLPAMAVFSKSKGKYYADIL